MHQPAIARYLRHGTFPQLRVFEASARLRSLTLAARELHIAQPTASVQIKKLSETVGLSLFEHVGNHIVLTDAGNCLHAGCQQLFAALATLEDNLNELRVVERGHLRLAACSTAQYFAPRLLAAFLQRFPQVEASLEIHNRMTLLERLANDQDDLYIFTSPVGMGDGTRDLVMQSLLSSPLVVLARDDHPLAGAARIRLERIAQEPLLLREPGSGTRLLVNRLFEQRRLNPTIRLQLNTDEAIKEAILAGLGVAILSRFTHGSRQEPAQLVCLDVEGFPLENRWHIAYPVGRQPGATAREFMEFARVETRRLLQATTEAAVTA